jgi:hypothetical protein
MYGAGVARWRMCGGLEALWKTAGYVEDSRMCGGTGGCVEC